MLENTSYNSNGLEFEDDLDRLFRGLNATDRPAPQINLDVLLANCRPNPSPSNRLAFYRMLAPASAAAALLLAFALTFSLAMNDPGNINPAVSPLTALPAYLPSATVLPGLDTQLDPATNLLPQQIRLLTAPASISLYSFPTNTSQPVATPTVVGSYSR
jgi:hypothetical protein